MRFARRSALALLFASLALCTARAEPPYDSIRAAVGAGRVEKTRRVGFGIGTAYAETFIDGGVLVGMDVALTSSGDADFICGLQPFYRTAEGVRAGRRQGRFEAEPKKAKTGPKPRTVRIVSLRSPPEHAAGAVTLVTGLRMDALALTYMPLTRSGLDRSGAVRGRWVGTPRNLEGTTIGGDGRFIAGVFGTRDNQHVQALGLLLARPEPPPRPRPAPASEPPKAQPAPPKAQQAPPQPRPEPVVFHDAQRGFRVTAPAGWEAMGEAEWKRVGALLQPEEAGRLLAGFRPGGAGDNGPWLLIGATNADTAVPLEELEAVGTTFRAGTGDLARIVRTTPLNGATLDRESARLVRRKERAAPGGAGARSLDVVCVGAGQVVFLHGIAAERQRSEHEAAFVLAAESFRFDAGREYVPPVQEAEERLPPWLPLAVFGAVSAVIFLPLALVLSLKGRGRSRAAEKDEPAEAAPPPLPEAPARTSAPPAQSGPMPFLRALCEERPFRIYLAPDELLFLDGGGEGPGGARERQRRLDEASPDELRRLAGEGRSFRGHVDSVLGASLEAPVRRRWPFGGGDVQGTLTIRLRHAGEHVFEFVAIDQMQTAVASLPGILGKRVRVSAVFDPEKRRFERPKEGAA